MLRILRRTGLHTKTLRQLGVVRNFHDEFQTPETADKEKIKPKLTPAISSKFQIFADDDSAVILDVEEERLNQTQKIIIPQVDIYEGINMQRGITGVFEVEELVDLLKRDNAEDIFVCSVPKSYKYVDYICVTSGRSFRHMSALAQFVRRVYKMKRGPKDILPRIEGEKSKDWMAMDLGNIALHIFSPSARSLYDLESLWSLGTQYDKEYNKPKEALLELYERHSIYLSDLKPKKINEDSSS